MRRRWITWIVAPTLVVIGLPVTAYGAGAPVRSSVVVGELQRIAVDFESAPGFELTVIVPDDGDAVRVESTDAVEAVPAGALVEAEVGQVTSTNQQADDADGGAEVDEVEILDLPDTADAAGPTDLGPATAQATPDSTLMTTTRAVHVRTGLIGSQAAGSVTAAQIAAEVTNEVAPYWSASTDGSIRFQVASQANAGRYDEWGSTSTCTTDQILGALAWAARKTGVSVNTGSHAVLHTPRFSACGFAGVAHVADGGVAWINGADSQRWATTAHELGHNLNLGHSDSRVACGRYSSADGFTSTCRNGAYGDAYDVMGTSIGGPGPLGAPHLDALGLLDGDNTVFANGPTTSALAPVGGLTGTRFLTFASNGQRYFVEYRAAVGRDSDLGSTRRGCPTGVSGCTVTRYTPGVIVRRVDTTQRGRSSYVLDAGAGDPRASSSDPWFVLPAGRSFTTADGSYVLTVTSVTSTRASVTLARPTNTVPNACPADVIGEDWFADSVGPFENYIDCVWHWGVTTGTSPTSYTPTRSVNREQMAAFIARLITASGGTLPSSPRDAFSDDESSSFERQINQLAAVGIVNGKSAGRYGPKDVVTRGQMAAFLTRAYDYRAAQAGLPALPGGPDAFPDDDGHPLEAVVDKAAAAGFATGYADGTFRPGASVRRDHMAAFLTRLIDPLVERRVASVPRTSAASAVAPH